MGFPSFKGPARGGDKPAARSNSGNSRGAPPPRRQENRGDDQPRKPSHYAKIKGEDGKWIVIGAAWMYEDTNSFNVKMDPETGIPEQFLNFRIYKYEPKNKE